MHFVLATRNKNKINEMKAILQEAGMSVTVHSLDDFPQCGDVVEDGTTFEANAVKKAVAIANCTGMAAIADDSGLEVDALGGAPGVYSARYSGDSADDTANLNKLLNEMKGVPYEKRTARFVCCIAMASGDDVKTFFGYADGRIGTEPKGKRGFGYDPVFYPDGHDRTFAEMSESEKNSMSHRYAALMKLANYLKKQV
ncbi:MAG: XTP/dITP diphosphatase [Nitrospirae bacterium]|nr:XTP/dITP diphosphatase [Nitrospirota bacterium]